MTDKFCPMYGLCSSVKTITGNQLTLADSDVEDDLCEQLEASAGKYTRLMLSTGVGYSEFKVTCVGGCLKLSPTPATQFIAGDAVWYESCSKDNIADLQACLAEEAATEAAGSGLKIAGFVLEVDENGNSCYVVDPATKESVTFQVGKQVITIDGTGCPTSKPAEAGTYLEPGEYPYATVTVGSNCAATGIKEGVKPVCSTCGCCSNGVKAEEVTSAGSV